MTATTTTTATPTLGPYVPAFGPPEDKHPYRSTDAGMFRVTKDDAWLPLTNFVAAIVEEVIEDDGVEQEKLLTIEVDGRRVQVAARDFSSMAWVVPKLGAGAVVNAGNGVRDHARAAIQHLSPKPIPTRHVFTHTGWRQVDGGAWVYLHGGGAIGAEGVEVRLPGAFRPFVLPEVTDAKAAIRASLGMLDAGPVEVTAPLLAAVYRSVLGGADFGLHLVGETGLGKSELVALAQQHFGADFDARHLPGSWTSTVNYLEGQAFQAKDALLVVDDFKPEGTGRDVGDLYSKFARLFRGVGNGAGRGRMNADSSLRETKVPRALILSTGEDYPRGHSVLGRALVLTLEDRVVGPDLDRHQRAGAEGLYAQAMAGYLAWMAPQYEAIRQEARERVREERSRLQVGGHARTPGIVADLVVGLGYFLDYAVEVGAISAAEALDLCARCRAAILDAGARQALGQEEARPERRFLDLVSSGLASGRFYIKGAGRVVDRDRATMIGYVEDSSVYLLADPVYAAVQRFSGEQGEAFTTSQKQLYDLLAKAGYLASVGKDGRKTIIKRQEGQRSRVLHLARHALEVEPGVEPALDDL